MKRTTVIRKDDIRNPLHPYLWESMMEDLGKDPNTDEVTICLAPKNNKFAFDDRVSLANNTSLVLGTVTAFADDLGIYVVWDDNLFYGSPLTEAWYEEEELEKV